MNSDLKTILLFFNKTQFQFAQDLGVSLTTISRWVNYKCQPSQMAKAKIKEVIERYEQEQKDQEQIDEAS